MIVIPQMAVTPSNLTSSTIPAVDTAHGEIAWASGTFAVGDIRVVASVGRKFMCLTAGSRTTSPELDPANWDDAGASNRFAMFDLYRNTQTVSSSTIVAVVALYKRIDATMFAGLVATSAKVEMLVGGSVVFTQEVNLRIRKTLTWSDYFFGEFENKESAVVQNLPMYSSASLRYTITNAYGDVKCGAVVSNKSTYIGDIESGAEADSLNFSKIERDQFGNAKLTPRKSYPRTSQTLIANSKFANKIRAAKTELDAVPAAWVGLQNRPDSDYFDMLNIIGVWKKFSLNGANTGYTRIQLELEEI